MLKLGLRVACGFLLAGVAYTWAAAPAPSANRLIILTDCSIRPLAESKVPARVSGVLADVKVKEGDAVKEGQVLAVVYDKGARLKLEEIQLKAKNPNSILIAEAKEREMDAQVADQIALRRNAPKEELRIKKAQLDIARHTTDLEKTLQVITQQQAKQAEEDVSQHNVVTLIDGVVIEQVRQKGDPIQAQEPIFHVIRTDVVKVGGTLPLRDVGRVVKGMKVDVFPNLPGIELWKLVGHTDVVNAVRSIGDGKLFASAGADRTIIIWDRDLGRQVRVLEGHEDEVHCLATHRAAPKRIVSGSADRTIRIWDVDADAAVATYKCEESPVLCLALSPTDPDVGYSGHEDRLIRVWNLKTGEVTAKLDGHRNHVTSLAITPDGKYLLSTDANQTNHVWELPDGKDIKQHRGRSLTSISEIGLSADGKYFLFDGYPVTQVRTLLEGLPVANIDTRAANPSGIGVFSPVAPLVVTATDNGKIQLWQKAGSIDGFSRLARTFEGHIGLIHNVDFSPDGNYLMTAGADRSVRVWEVPSHDSLLAERREGTVSLVNPQVETASLTVPMYAEVDNRDGLLLPGGSATMVIRPGQAPAQAAR